MHRLEEFLSVLNKSLDTKRKRHMVGGILLSTALLLGGLAFTAITYKPEDKHDGEHS